jgi:hypothetical protein
MWGDFYEYGMLRVNHFPHMRFSQDRTIQIDHTVTATHSADPVNLLVITDNDSTNGLIVERSHEPGFVSFMITTSGSHLGLGFYSFSFCAVDTPEDHISAVVGPYSSIVVSD